MTRVYSPQELSAVMKLSAEQRLEHFVKQAADAQRFFLVKQHGRLMAFHAAEYAVAAGLSAGVLEQVDLDDAIQRDWGEAVAIVLPTTSDTGAEIPMESLVARLRQELDEFY